ncbi:N-acetylmuramoyl-L-alanine amidase [Cytobacillus spongiae]|uniref:N-acetylmuramoyl-L-alanine amidase n=1 Tax=Cytobacillus spongiae TaxID=2901381 RepID=UPI001F32A980|nr:N-acetylmuramoyl-L-alanine amidase [Cytobacillus spongiae]UII56723.1 N-acetylmuramoyl-L-alanine amidase [Cytobacillus spongiae]
MLKISLEGGHGENTPGKRSPDDYREWSYNQAIVKFIMAELNNYENVAVLRVDDPTGKRDVPLKERTDRVNGWGSNVHVSVHHNAVGSKWCNATGTETYVYTSKPKEALALASKVQANLVKNLGFTNRGVKSADFHILRETNMTAILVEVAFMDNKDEAMKMRTVAYQKKAAIAIVTCLAQQYGLKKKESSPKPSLPAKESLFKVQVGAFVDKSNADKLAEELKKKGYPTYIVQE